MGTFASIQTRVQNRTIDLPASVQAEIPALVNLAVNKIQEKHNFKVMEGELAFVTNHLAGDGGRFLGQTPTSFKEFRNGDPFWIKNDGTVRTIATAQKRGDVWGPDYLDNADIGFPLAIVMENGMVATSGDFAINFDVYPLPDGNSDFTDGEYRIFIPTFNYTAPLVAGGDTNWFTLHAEEWVVAYATSEAMAVDWNFEGEQLWTSRANKFYNDVVLQDKRARLAGVTTLVPHRLGARQSKLRL